MSEPEVRFAIISSAPAASALLETVCEEIVRRTSKAITPVVFRSYDKLALSMRDGSVQVAWAPPLVAIDLERETKAKIRLCSRRSGRTDYMSVLFVKASSKIDKVERLTDKRVAWVAKESSAGYVVPRFKLAALGLDPDKLFKEQSFRRTHEAVARAVFRDEADVGATYAHFDPVTSQPTAGGWEEAGAKTSDVRVLTYAGPIPSDVIAMAPGLPEETAQAISAAMRELGEPIKKLLNAESFVEPQVSHFDELRRLVDSVKSQAS